MRLDNFVNIAIDVQSTLDSNQGTSAEVLKTHHTMTTPLCGGASSTQFGTNRLFCLWYTLLLMLWRRNRKCDPVSTVQHGALTILSDPLQAVLRCGCHSWSSSTCYVVCGSGMITIRKLANDTLGDMEMLNDLRLQSPTWKQNVSREKHTEKLMNWIVGPSLHVQPRTRIDSINYSAKLNVWWILAGKI